MAFTGIHFITASSLSSIASHFSYILPRYGGNQFSGSLPYEQRCQFIKSVGGGGASLQEGLPAQGPPNAGTVVGKSKWYHQVFQGSFHLKWQAVPLNLTWVDLAFSCTKGYPGQVKRHSLPVQVEAVRKYLVVPGVAHLPGAVT